MDRIEKEKEKKRKEEEGLRDWGTCFIDSNNNKVIS